MRVNVVVKRVGVVSRREVGRVLGVGGYLFSKPDIVIDLTSFTLKLVFKIKEGFLKHKYLVYDARIGDRDREALKGLNKGELLDILALIGEAVRVHIMFTKYPEHSRITVNLGSECTASMILD